MTTVDSTTIGERLARYLGVAVEKCTVLASGWETTVFEVAVTNPIKKHEIPAHYPLALRFYQGKDGHAKAAREFKVLKALTGSRCPVPQPYLVESDPEPLGAPFLLMERVSGGPLLYTRSFPKAFKTFSLAFFSFVRSHVELHRVDIRKVGLEDLPPAFCPGGEGHEVPLLNRILRTVTMRVKSGPLPHLQAALSWALERVHKFPEAQRSLVHLDYHPLNAIVHGVRLTGVIDWVFADLGDRHLDAAMTAMIMASYAFERPRWLAANLCGNTLRRFFSTLYIALYHSMAPLDFKRFRYCQAVAALHRLSMFGIMRRRGAEQEGFRPEAAADVTPAAMRLLSRYASRKTGIAIPLDYPSALAA